MKIYIASSSQQGASYSRAAATHLPRDVQLVVTDEVGVVALERIKDEGLVRLGDLRLQEAPLIREIHLRRDRARVQTRDLRVQLEVDRLRGLDADHELIARDVLEDALRDVLELDPDFDLGLIQC